MRIVSRDSHYKLHAKFDKWRYKNRLLDDEL
jgi:hypothetical protein